MSQWEQYARTQSSLPFPFKEDDLWNGYPEETNATVWIGQEDRCWFKRKPTVAQYAFNAYSFFFPSLTSTSTIFSLQRIYLLPVNLYGPRDNFDLESSHVIPAMIRKCAEAKQTGAAEIVLWGDGSPTREFLYVEDAAEAIFLAAEHYNADQPVNLGSGEEISIRDLAQLITEEVGFKGRITWDTTKPNGQPRRCLDVSRAKELFGFHARHNFREGIRKTVAWYLTQRNCGIKDLTVE